ncbi:MAG: hypothetical protein ACFFDF_14955 [Candidatus Odinarchaeota archaeon]
MEEIQFNKLYKLDKERLYSNFQRIQNMNKDLKSTEIVAKFLYNQSIGSSIDQILEILNYFHSKLSKENKLLEFAFEWIRANKIRLEYKKFITLNNYNTYTTALDDTIFLFFLKYDEYLRALFKSTLEEYEFSTLYQILFNPKQSESVNLTALLEKNKAKVHTIIIDGEKINTTIHTLREGLSDMIRNDYKDGIPSDIKILNYEKHPVIDNAIEKDFNGTMVERLIKFYCFQRRKIDKRELTLAINQFLSSYFEFGLFYNFNEFKEKLVSNFVEYIYSGLTEKYEDYSIESIKDELNLEIEEFEKSLEQIRLKGKAWIEDIKPVLQNFIENFIGHL